MRLGFDAGPQQTLMVPEVWLFLCHALRDPSFCSCHARYPTNSRSLNPKERAKEKNQRHHRKERARCKRKGNFFESQFSSKRLMISSGILRLLDTSLSRFVDYRKAKGSKRPGDGNHVCISVCPNLDIDWRVVLGMCVFVVRNQCVF